MSQLQDLGRQIMRNNEKTSDTLYQRKAGGAEMIPPTMKQLVLFTELLVQSGRADASHAAELQKWQNDFGRLVAANESGDLILAADILHHDLNSEIQAWIE